MLYLLDSANTEEIKKACDIFPLAGVTTNPTIITKEKKPFFAEMSARPFAKSQKKPPQKVLLFVKLAVSNLKAQKTSNLLQAVF